MSYKTYDEYENIYNPFYKQKPLNWNIYKLKYLISSLESGKRKYFENASYALSLGGEHINWEGTINLSNKRYITKDFYYSMNKGKIHENDILLVKDGATIGKTAFIDNLSQKMAVNEHVFILRPNNKLLAKLLYYLISSHIGFTQIKLTETGSAQSGISQDILDKVEFIIPPSLKLQDQMINFLDGKITNIDKTISKNEELIKLLEEKRVALINQVVTKGLNPDVRMKDSGIEWIGEIPEHWDIASLSHYSNVTKLAGFEFTEHIEYVPNGEIIALRALNIRNNKLNLNNIVKITKEVSDKLPRSKLRKDDLIFTYVGAKTGAVALIDKDNTYHLAPNIAKITNISKDKLNTKFLLYNIASHHEQEEIWFKISKSGQEAISMEKIRTLSLLIPPIDEQKLIIDYLDEKTSKINKTIEKIKYNINLLNEYKTSLIHHVVTGKIDVRGEEI